ncbi:hypothetical protein [Asaia bogorensis]|uniref:hypothetical protein n=1 Tax=Asaia bogorensis TaxID=91915 RepID=UPI0030164C9F
MFEDTPDVPWMEIQNIKVHQDGILWSVRAEFICTDSDPEVLELKGQVAMRLSNLQANSPMETADLIRRRVASLLLRSAEGIEADE